MKRRTRWHKKKLVYYPAAGALALSSFFGGKRLLQAKANGKDRRVATMTLGAAELEALRDGVRTELPTLSHARLGSDEILQSSHRHYQLAQAHLQRSELEQAGLEADEAYRFLSRLSGHIDPQQDRIRDELRLELARMVVLLNEANAGGGPTEAPQVQLASSIQLEMNDRVAREIRNFQTDQRATFVQGYRLAGAHMQFIEKKLSERGMPRELGWLPLIESGFKTHAESQVQALGLWQFMPATGKSLGLDRDRWVDERMNPEEATEAAIRYLRYLHDSFEGDWNKALAAYNWGEGNLRKAIRRCNKKSPGVSYWDLKARMPEETNRYVPKFLAAVHIASDPAAYGFPNLDPGVQIAPARYELVETEKQMDMAAIESAIGAESDSLRNLNPELLHRITPPQKHLLRVPAGTAEMLRAKLEVIPEYRPKPRTEPSTLVAKRKRKSRRKSEVPVLVASKKSRKPPKTTAPTASAREAGSSTSRKAASSRKSVGSRKAGTTKADKAKRPRRRA